MSAGVVAVGVLVIVFLAFCYVLPEWLGERRLHAETRVALKEARHQLATNYLMMETNRAQLARLRDIIAQLEARLAQQRDPLDVGNEIANGSGNAKT